MMRAAAPAPTINPAAVVITGGSVDGTTMGGGTAGPITATALVSTGSTILKGTTAGDSAAAGNIGEIITATVALGAAVTLSNGVGTNIATISLTAGDWDVSGVIDFVLSGVTATLFQSGISLVSATLPGQPGGAGLGTDPLINVPLLTTVLSATYSQALGPVRISVASTTNVFLVADGTFSVGTLTAYGTIRARRIR